jgi:Flp pilus assembly protein TadG
VAEEAYFCGVDAMLKHSTRPMYSRFLWARLRAIAFRKARDERGASIVEMALSIAVLMSLVIGIMEMSLALYTFHFISEAARDGSRYAIVRGSSCPAILPGCPAAGAGVDVQTYLRNQGFPTITPGLMTVSTTWPTTGSSCTPSSSPCDNPGNLVKVVVVYRFPLSIPFIPASTLNMSSTSQMVISQ